MRRVECILIVGIGVDGSHKPCNDAKLVVQHFCHRGQAVGSAGSTGNDGFGTI